MSLLNAWVSPDRALVATDTDSLTAADAHYGMSKILHLAHARTLFAGRGDRKFLWDIFARYYLADGEVDFDSIIASFPDLLASAILGVRQGGYAPFGYQFAVVGWSPAEGRMCGRWYTGNTGQDGYDVDELGQRVAPWEIAEKARVPDSDENIQWLAKRQVAWLRSKGSAGGGDLLIAEITRTQLALRNVGRITA